jgi:predicted PurR-regulated permease PerM
VLGVVMAVDQRDPRVETSVFAYRVLIAVGILVFIGLLLLLIWQSVHVLLLLFAGVLVAVFVRGLANWLCHKTKLPPRPALCVVLLGLAALFAFSMWILVPRIAGQVGVLAEELPRAVERLTEQIGQYEWGKRLLQLMPETGSSSGFVRNVLSRAMGIFSTTLGAVVGLGIVLFAGLYLAFDPGSYVDGIIKLVPKTARWRAREVVHALGVTLAHWMIGRFFAMALVSFLTAVGYALLGVRLALTLGIIAGLFSFVPNIGPVAAVVPAVLLALLQSQALAVRVILVYLLIQTLESYVFTPLVQRHEISMPPILTLSVQIVFGAMWGILGLTLATPITASMTVLVKMLYIEDILRDTAAVPGGKR